MDFKSLLLALVAAMNFSTAATPTPMPVVQPTTLVEQISPQQLVPAAEAAKSAQTPYTAEDVEALARIVYWEARGEGEKGQIAVANVVLNRVRDPRWPDTIQQVIAQKSQFTPYKNKRYFKVTIPRRYVDIAKRALNGEKAIPDDYFFFSVGEPRRYAKDFIRIGGQYFGRIK